MSIVNVKEIVENRKENLRQEIIALKEKNITPKLAVILASDNEASKVYVGTKRRMCESLQIEEEEYIFDDKTTTKELLEVIDRLNKDSEVDAILVQLPLFKHLDESKILNAIAVNKDVDGFSALNIGKLYQGIPFVVPCTPKGILTILKELEPNLSGKNAVVIGRSLIVGKPMAMLLLNESMTVTICHSKTKNLKEYTKMADVLIVATGKPKIITKDMVKKDSIIIDVGLSRLKDKLVGDVDTLEVDKVAKYVTPVPGGVGLTTVSSLAENIVMLAKENKQ